MRRGRGLVATLGRRGGRGSGRGGLFGRSPEMTGDQITELHHFILLRRVDDRCETKSNGRPASLVAATVRPPWKRPWRRAVDLQERAVMDRAIGIVKGLLERTAPSRDPIGN